MDGEDEAPARIEEKHVSKRKSKVSEFYPPIPRPMYKGAPFPNRFNILPGYRWDGQDRSNQWEKKWFLNQNKREAKESESYSYSTSGM